VVDDGQHAACVEAWLERAAGGLSTPALRRLLETALGALWARTEKTLGEVTLAAIAGRVLYTGTERFSFLASFKVGSTRGIAWVGGEGLAPPLESQMREGVRFLLVEFLSVLGHLTAEILTPELHAELMGVTLPQGVHLVKEQEASPAHARSAGARRDTH